ncbi:endo alpha-1,4 polygalactosaminidase [Streptomyces sp. NPDC020742]|uniref:endo alpha-1,4 polygalactosaminidase n=1 Tax=unclassified Streptomyces TaxID=2593676 RepID=UPI0033FB4E73
MPPSRPVTALAGLLVLAFGTACSPTASAPSTPSTSSAPSTSGSDNSVRPPAADAAFDYQLGGAYPPAGPVRVVSRDRTAEPAAGRYNICYVNAFQAQPEGVEFWRKHHPDLLLRDGRGELVIDEDWNEPLLDISTAPKRRALMGVVGPWIDGCAKAGYDAVEPDNLDSYERSGGRLTARQAAAFARLLARRAHQHQLAVAQKNTADLLPRRKGIGFDFAVVEECTRYQECTDFADAYHDRVFVVEYTRRDFTAACRSWGGRLSLTLRDRDVRPAGAAGHVEQRC